MVSVQALPLDTSPLGAPPTRLADLHPGLLVFFARPSLLQTWAEFFGHEWRHVGITVQTEDGLRVASYCIRKCFRVDDPVEIITAYNRVGIAQIFSDEAEVREFERYCRNFEYLDRSDSPYTTSGIFIGPIHLLARRCRPGLARDLLLRLVTIYCLMQQWRYRDRSAFGCSTFAWAGIASARSRPLRIPLSAHPDDETSYATPTNETDELFARWLCGPSEIWDAISPPNRSELDLTDLGLAPVAVSTLKWGPHDEEVASSSSQTHPRWRAPLSAIGAVASLLRVGGWLSAN